MSMLTFHLFHSLEEEPQLFEDSSFPKHHSFHILQKPLLKKHNGLSTNISFCGGTHTSVWGFFFGGAGGFVLIIPAVLI